MSSGFLFYYHGVSPTTWVYLSSLLMIGLYFKFGRFWSVRNLDLVLLILLAPGLLLIQFGRYIQFSERGTARLSSEKSAMSGEQSGDASIDSDLAGLAEAEQAAAAEASGTEVTIIEPADVQPEGMPQPGTARPEIAATHHMLQGQRVERLGFVWLFCAGGVMLARLLIDSMMVRRPLLAPNLSVGGLAFIGCALYVFLMANVIAQEPTAGQAKHTIATDDFNRPTRLFPTLEFQGNGPGYAVLAVLPDGASKAVAIGSHLAVILGMVLIGYWHFENVTMGIGAATLYLMLPYTALMTGLVDHVLPAAFLVWAILCYPQPLASGIFLGLSGGVVYYPLFLLPLWISFYWQRGLVRFLIGMVSMLAVLAVILAFTSGESDYLANLQRMFGLWPPRIENLDGIWNVGIGGWDPHFRLPVLAGFLALSGGLALWPAQKNLGTLLSCSAAVMLASQFWHGFGGGIYMAWYLPLALLTIFRPNLEDRVALTMLEEGWFPRRRAHLSSVDKAA